MKLKMILPIEPKPIRVIKLYKYRNIDTSLTYYSVHSCNNTNNNGFELICYNYYQLPECVSVYSGHHNNPIFIYNGEMLHLSINFSKDTPLLIGVNTIDMVNNIQSIVFSLDRVNKIFVEEKKKSFTIIELVKEEKKTTHPDIIIQDLTPPDKACYDVLVVPLIKLFKDNVVELTDLIQKMVWIKGSGPFYIELIREIGHQYSSGGKPMVTITYIDPYTRKDDRWGFEYDTEEEADALKSALENVTRSI